MRSYRRPFGVAANGSGSIYTVEIDNHRVQKFSCSELPPCGTVFMGTCLFLGGIGETCTDFCTSVGRVYDPATRTLVGSDGTDANCDTVLTALGRPGTVASGTCGFPIGCHNANSGPSRCTSPPDDLSVVFARYERACGCQ